MGSYSGSILSNHWWVFLGLTAFGIGYNALVAWMERKGYAEGLVSLLVVVGVLVTLGGAAIINGECAAWVLAAFVCSGLPMVAGSLARYVKARDIEHDVARGVDGNHT